MRDMKHLSDNPAANQWAMFVHFSLFAGFILPVAGLVLPIIIWQVKKDEYPFVDLHGKQVLNWIVSLIIYSLICAVFTLIFIGFIGFAALFVMSIAFPIIGGIKANNGEFWRYPFTIRVIK